MKHLSKILLVIALVTSLYPVSAQTQVSDSVDALHYNLYLDIGNNEANRIKGYTTVTLRLLQVCDSVDLELSVSDIDSVLVNGTATGYSYAVPNLKVPVSSNVGDTITVTVFYRKGQYIASGGWGGFYFDNNIYYNLGIAIYEYPHNMGKTWFPCRDNFYDKATYHFAITAKPQWKAICTGLKDSIITHSDGSSTWYWTLNRPTPTYLVGVAVAPFHLIERSFDGATISYPALLGFLSHDSIKVWKAFDYMSRVIPFYEQCFGPYQWDRVGYVSTPKGSMEHVGNIAFTTNCMASSQEACLATMSHEFAHSWFGNLITCTNSENMWINEGGASFAEEVAIQAICPGDDSLRYKSYADENLNTVLLTTHITDDGFRAVHGVSHEYTYGSTVYSKGATVWHSLRGYLGDSLFYYSLRTLFNRCAFDNIDSYQLRDSLSLYSGIDLTDFFDFHVFGPGFNDYVIDSLTSNGDSATVYLKQKNYGTSSLMNSNRVWITFFSSQLETESRLISFDGASTSATFTLPFTPAFTVVDYDKALSKASIGSAININAKGEYNMDVSHFKTGVRVASDSNTAFLYINHHWCAPDTSLCPQFLRMADRYWDVTGILPSSVKLSGHFHYCRSGTERTLDDNLYSGSEEFEQVRLLYRENTSSDWKVVSSMVSGGSSQGYRVINNLKLGQYTLAVIDTNFVAIDQPDSPNSQLKIFPNPSNGTLTIETSELGEHLLLDITSPTGLIVKNNIHLKSGESINCNLPQGAFIFNVTSLKNNKKYSKKVIINSF